MPEVRRSLRADRLYFNRLLLEEAPIKNHITYLDYTSGGTQMIFYPTRLTDPLPAGLTGYRGGFLPTKLQEAAQPYLEPMELHSTALLSL